MQKPGVFHIQKPKYNDYHGKEYFNILAILYEKVIFMTSFSRKLRYILDVP